MSQRVKLQAIVLHQGRYILELPNGTKAFVKASSSTQRRHIDGLRAALQREKICLRVLRGLAVPRLISLPTKSLPAYCRTPGMSYIAQSWEGEKIDHVPLTPLEALGAWLFLVEQLTAFRRHRILYTDVKCANVLVQRHPLRVVVIDFGTASPLEPGRFPLRQYGFTRGFEAPECRAGKVPTERSLVYPLGILLPHVLVGTTTVSIKSAHSGLDAASRILRRIGAADAADVVCACLADDPRRRPPNYEAVLKRLRSCVLPAGTTSVWRHLRDPYRRRLAKLGLGDNGGD